MFVGLGVTKHGRGRGIPRNWFPVSDRVACLLIEELEKLQGQFDPDDMENKPDVLEDRLWRAEQALRWPPRG